VESGGLKLYARLLRYVAPYRRAFAGAIGAMVVLAATEPAMPALLKPTLDEGFLEKDLDTVALMSVLMVVIFLVRGLSSYASTFAMAWVSGKVVMDLRVDMFEKLLALPSTYFDTHPSARLISRITFDANQVTEAASYVLTVLVKDSLAILGLLAWMFYLNWQLALVSFTAMPVVVVVVYYFSKRLRLMSHKLQETMGEVTQDVNEAIGGQKEIRIFGAQAFERERFARTANWVRRFQIKFASSAAAVAPIAQLATATAAAVILYFASTQAVAGDITVGGFASFFGAMALLFSPLKRITGINSRLQKGLAGAASVFSLLDEQSEQDTGTRRLESVEGRVEFKGVSFSYESGSDITLNDLSFVIEPGTTVALVGASGSGKSTLANLIPRFYRPTAGHILIDGVDVEDVTLHSLRNHVALVSQDIVLFDDTLGANIAYGPLAETPTEAIMAAAQSAHAAGFIAGLDDGLETLIGENGVRLSGGQRQRIAIARAFLKDTPILILDEATSSLDAVSEQQVGAALESLRTGRTTVVIAHKLSTIETADHIIVLDNGKIIGQGRHDTLLRDNQVYAALYRFQFSTHESGNEGAEGEVRQH